MARRRAVCGKPSLTDGITVDRNDLSGDAPPEILEIRAWVSVSSVTIGPWPCDEPLAL